MTRGRKPLDPQRVRAEKQATRDALRALTQVTSVQTVAGRMGVPVSRLHNAADFGPTNEFSRLGGRRLRLVAREFRAAANEILTQAALLDDAAVAAPPMPEHRRKPPTTTN
jgi:hypothetical protein